MSTGESDPNPIAELPGELAASSARVEGADTALQRGALRPMGWNPTTRGLLRLPSGRVVRGRGLGEPEPDGPEPQLGIYLLDEQPPVMPWQTRWVLWPDFGLPSDPAYLRTTLDEAWRRAEVDRVEVACLGGHGRTGTALACLTVLDGLSADDAVSYVRQHYCAAAVETLQQQDFVRRFR